MKIKRISNYFLIILFIIQIMIFNILPVYATTYGRISATNGVKLRSGPGTGNYSKVVTVPHNTIVTIVEQNVETDDNSTGCTTGLWHKVTYNNYTGYACSRYVEIQSATEKDENEIPKSDMANMTAEEFETYLTNQGFPESYKVKLRVLHAAHPNWVFVGIKTRDNWSNALKQQNVAGRSTYQSTSSSSQGYLSTEDGHYNWYTDKFNPEDGTSWFQANSQTIAYYMDPRNFLTEDGIFMFEDLNYYSSYQTSDTVEAILYSDFYKDLIIYYIEAATTYNVSPIYLAALSRQEVGLNAGYATSGTTSTYCSEDYTGYYNFYNIQATAGTKPVCNGLAYAVTKGWDTKQKAIVGGASWIVSGYINAGQNTAYFQKWNTSSKATKEYYHQYMSNIRAVASSSKTTKTSYSNMGILEYPFVFQIPIYDGIPASTSLPPTGNPNNWLKTLNVNNTLVTNFDSDETSYTVNVPAGTTSVNVSATTINENAKINGTGTIALTNTSTTVNLIVTAQNGNQKTYTVTIIRPENTNNEDKEDNKDNNTENNDQNTDNNHKENENENNNNTENNNQNTDNSNQTNEQDKTEGNETITLPTTTETVTGAGYKIKDNTYLTNVTLGSTVQGTITKLQKSNQYASINITNSSNKAKTSGSLVTGDKITIVSNNESKTYTVVIYGDTNGDGEITTLDLLRVQKNILKQSTLTGAYSKAADVDKNGSITTLDLLKVQKHILKISNISQS